MHPTFVCGGGIWRYAVFPLPAKPRQPPWRANTSPSASNTCCQRSFSRRAYEGIYILDPFYQNKSGIQPDTVHADTHGQSVPIFGLAFILGIQLMPRIRNWKHLTFYRPSQAIFVHRDGYQIQ